jgi:hypothetical protein
LRFDSKTFIEFIKNNNDIFHFDTVSPRIRLVIFASNKDTILNPAFLDFFRLHHRSPKSKLLWIVRQTTEEENYVMHCKRNHINCESSKLENIKSLSIDKESCDSKYFIQAKSIFNLCPLKYVGCIQ